MISKVILRNFKQFQNIEIDCNKDKNILVGENGAGKSTILTAIGLVLSGSYAQIEKVGLVSLFNCDIVSDFLKAQIISSLPEVFVELYFDESAPEIFNNFHIEGKHNSKKIKSFGATLRIAPDKKHTIEIKEALRSSDWTVFPYEFYKVEFISFSGESYNSYNKPFGFLYNVINTSLIDTNQEIQKRIDEVYQNRIPEKNRAKVNHEFRKSSMDLLRLLEKDQLMLGDESEFSLHFEESEKLFRNSISAVKNGIDIKQLGQGEKVLLGVENSYKNLKENVKILLIEEPENHLSYVNMQKLINLLTQNTGVQVFIGTHSNMVASRLGVNNLILLSEGRIAKIPNLEKDTVRFFKKSTNQNLLNFTLSDRLILVEGNAEYILMEKFFKIIHKDEPNKFSVSIISVDGLSFKRYLEIAKNFSNKKVAVITDNDGDYSTNIKENYTNYDNCDNIKVFSDINNDNRTFEVCLYNRNKELIKKFKITQSSDIQAYMLREKAEFALRLLEMLELDNNKFKIPEYIEEAIKWVVKN